MAFPAVALNAAIPPSFGCLGSARFWSLVEFINPHATNLICSHQEENCELKRYSHCPRQAYGLDVSILIWGEHWRFDDRTPNSFSSVSVSTRVRALVVPMTPKPVAGLKAIKSSYSAMPNANVCRIHRLGLDRLRRDTFIHHIAEHLLDCGALYFLDWETMEA